MHFFKTLPTGKKSNSLYSPIVANMLKKSGLAQTKTLGEIAFWNFQLQLHSFQLLSCMKNKSKCLKFLPKTNSLYSPMTNILSYSWAETGRKCERSNVLKCLLPYGSMLTKSNTKSFQKIEIKSLKKKHNRLDIW